MFSNIPNPIVFLIILVEKKGQQLNLIRRGKRHMIDPGDNFDNIVFPIVILDSDREL